MNPSHHFTFPKIPKLPHYAGPVDFLQHIGAWAWVHLVSPLWRNLEGWPAWCWTLPVLALCLGIFFIWRRWAGMRLAYWSPTLFNVVHGRFWLPLLVSSLWGMLLFGSPLLALAHGPAWRADAWWCITVGASPGGDGHGPADVPLRPDPRVAAHHP